MAQQSQLASLVAELRRRRVFRVAAFYGGIAVVIIGIVPDVFAAYDIPGWVSRTVITLLFLGFPVAMFLAWIFDITEEGIVRTKRAKSTGRSASADDQITSRQLTFSADIEEYPALSADGARLAFCRNIDGFRQIIIKETGSSDELQITHGNADCIQPAWSPDEGSILYAQSNLEHGKFELGDVFGMHNGGDTWSVEVDAGNQRKLIDDAFNPAFSPDGSRIAFDASLTGVRRIWTADYKGRNIEQLSTDDSESAAHIRPRWSPDGSRVIFQHIQATQFNLMVINVQSKDEKWVTEDIFQDFNPVWFRSGEEVYFSSFRSGGINIWRIKADRSTPGAEHPQPVTTGAGQDIQLSMSRDGSQLAYATLRQNADIWRLPISGETGEVTGEPQQVIATTREDSRGAWSPDGKRIAFNSDRDGHMNIWLYNIDSSDARQITHTQGGDFQANWSPDGSKIVFFSSRSGHTDIWDVDVISGELRQLTHGHTININPFYSPDGDSIAYQSGKDGRLEVWVMKPDGTDQRMLTDTGVIGHFLRWSADGDGVIYRLPGGTTAQLMQISLSSGNSVPFAQANGGAHISFSPDHSLIMDVEGHKTLWVSPVAGGAPRQVYQFADDTIRIDYPVWSPDGEWLLFDRFQSRDGDIWMLSHFA